MRILALSVLCIAILGCNSPTDVSEDVDSGVAGEKPFVVIVQRYGPGEPCDYVFVSGESGPIGVVFSGDTTTLYGSAGEGLEAKWRTKCTINATETADTVLVDSLVWEVN